MKIRNVFTVSRPVSQVWAMFQDVPAVSRCLPGANLTEDRGGGKYAGTMAVKLGPIAPSFEVEANVTTDEPALSALIEGAGVDRRGGSRASAKVTYALAAAAAGTEVTIDADITLSGPAAQFGRTGLIEEMSKRLIGEFSRCLEAKAAAATPEEAAAIQAGDLNGVSLLASSVWSKLRG